MKKMLTIMAVAIAATAIGGYGDLPDAFNASTGYVTLDVADTLLTHSSFWDGTNWSDGEPPHSTTNYYVNKLFSTLMDASVINAKIAQDPTALTFKGRMLVADANASLYLYSANFDIPDLHMLPGSQIYWGSNQPEVRGRMTTYGTTTSPARITYGLSGIDIRQPFGMDVKGDASSWISVYAPAVKSGSSVAYSGLIAFTGDLSEYRGTFKIANIMNGAGADHETHYGIELASSASNAAFAVESKGCVYVTAPEGAEVRSLSIVGDDTLIRLNSANLSQGFPRLTVGDSMAANGHKVSIALSSHSLPASGQLQKYNFTQVNPTPQEDVALIRLKPAAVANGGFGDLHKTFVWVTNNVKTEVMTEWRDDTDGGKTLWLLCSQASSLYNDSQDYASMVNARTKDGSHNFWSDGASPADPASASKRYFSDKTMHVPAASGSTPFAFGGRLLALSGTSFNIMNGGYGFYCPKLVLNNAIFRMCNATSTADGRKYEEDGQLFRVYRIQGEKLVILDHSVNDFGVWGTCQVLRVESEIEGGGTIKCASYPAGDYNNDRAFYEFTALNTNFTGKISLTMPYKDYATAGITVPNWNQRTRLFVYDERNLGGWRDTFAYDALYLDHYSELFPLNDVTFTDGWNRGIAIGDIGRMNVTNNLTLTILRPLNVNGNLVKEGAGTLALGGTLTFGGETQSTTPTAGQNLLTIKGGSIKPLAAHAFDGFAITFTNNASIKLDATTADADLLNYGIVDVKETTAPITLAANQATIPVTVTPPAGYPPSFTVAICTIGATPAASLSETVFSVANTAHHRCRRVEKRTNPDGTVTYLATFVSKGFAIDFR